MVRHIEIICGSVGVILAMFFATVLLMTSKEQRRANLFLAIYLLAFSLRIGKSLFHNYFEIDPWIRNLLLTPLLLVGPSIWLYLTHLIEQKERVAPAHYLHFIIFLIGVSLTGVIPNDGSPIFGVFYNFLIAHMLGYTVFTLWWTSDKKFATNQEKPTLQLKWPYIFLGVNLLFLACYAFISFVAFSYYIGISILFSLVVIFLSLMALTNPSIFKKPLKRYEGSGLASDRSEELMNQLKMFIEKNKPYLNPDLTLSALSELMGLSAKELSQVINQVESLNFSQFISRYRVEEVRRVISDGSNEHLKIAAIAYQCGFNSISTFNTAFKKHMGMTAKDFRTSCASNVESSVPRS